LVNFPGELIMRQIPARRAAIGLALIVMMTACGWLGTARAQSNDSNILYKRMTELYQAGKFAEAIPLVERYAEATSTLPLLALAGRTIRRPDFGFDSSIRRRRSVARECRN